MFNKKIFSEYKPDVVIHCAAKILLNYSDKDLVWKTNYYATKKLCELSEKNNVKKFVFFSTFSIFQKNYENPIDENEIPTYKTAYGETKHEAEKMLLKMIYLYQKIGDLLFKSGIKVTIGQCASRQEPKLTATK